MYVYKEVLENKWERVDKVVPFDGNDGDQFGYTVDIDANQFGYSVDIVASTTIVVGAWVSVERHTQICYFQSSSKLNFIVTLIDHPAFIS